jgi:hypothetical protein
MARNGNGLVKLSLENGAVEPVVGGALAEDPYAGGELFAGLRARVSARVSSVRAQAAANVPAPRR